MNKRLSQQQIKRIQKRQARHHQDAKNNNSHTQQQGLLIARFGKQADIETTTGQIIRCDLRQHLGEPVVGDHVIWQTNPNGHHVIVTIMPRHSLLARPQEKGTQKVIAANIDQIVIVTAPLPKPVPSLLDSYLVAAESLHIQPIIVINKIDLLDNTSKNDTHTLQIIYQNIGYTVISTSVINQQGFTKLCKQLAEKISIFVGQSGVGKSSLIAQLIPTANITAHEVSAKTAHGKHTTTTAQLYHLPTGGSLIDSPGIREFGLWHMQAEEIAAGFIEFRPYLGTCKFRNCLHLEDTYCALAQAVQRCEIHPSRLENYRRLIRS